MNMRDASNFCNGDGKHECVLFVVNLLENDFAVADHENNIVAAVFCEKPPRGCLINSKRSPSMALQLKIYSQQLKILLSALFTLF